MVAIRKQGLFARLEFQKKIRPPNKIMTHYDFDGDTISDAEEVHQEGLYELNPIIPHI